MSDTAAIDSHLISMLRCPVTLSPVALEGTFLVSKIGGLKYPVRDGIPVMLAEEAELPAGVATLAEFKEKFAPAPV